MRKATRERKIQFMRDFSSSALLEAAVKAFRHHGPDWLTDEQLDEIVSQQVSEWRDTQRMNLRNRQIARKRAADARAEIAKIVSQLRADGMRCNCDLDNWQPEKSTGHSHVCRIHNIAMIRYREADSHD